MVKKVMSANKDVVIEDIERNARQAAQLLKALSHESRLRILCQLASGERSVTELEQILAVRQAAVSQQLARLRFENLVATRREGKTIYYSLSDERMIKILNIINEMFCSPHSNKT